MKTRLQVSLQAGKRLRLDIYDVIGWSWYDDGITAKSISRLIKDAGDVDEIELHINSPGGDAFEGIAIHNVLKEHPAKVTVVVDGVAASAASIIAMAGDTVRIPVNGMLMIHDPATYAFGGEADLQRAIATLQAVKAACVETYLAKSAGKQTKEQITLWMSEEKWFIGQEAVDAGLADTTTAELTLPQVEPAANVQQKFKRAPEQFSALVALCAPPPPSQEQTLSTNPNPNATNPAPVTNAAPVTNPAPTQLSQADVDKQVSDKALAVENAERNRAGDIMAACTLAKKPEMAAEFIKNGTSLSDVRAKLLEVVCASNAPVGEVVNNNLTNTEPKVTGPDAKYHDEYAANPHLKARMSVEDYVKSRRIDDGLDPLAPAKK